VGKRKFAWVEAALAIISEEANGKLREIDPTQGSVAYILSPVKHLLIRISFKSILGYTSCGG
jgi:hypothetical protein